MKPSASHNAQDALTLFGWLALFDALRLANEKDPGCRVRIDAGDALARYVARRRDVLLHHHQPDWKS